MKQFDEIAEYYDDLFPKHIAEHYFLKRMDFLTQLVEKGKVLDVCSGTGLISEGLIKKRFKIISLDLSMNMLLIRKHVKDYLPVQGISYELPFQSDVFDLVLSVAAFHHIAEREKINRTINEMKRVTKRGGVIVIWDHNPINPYWKVIMKKVPQDTGEERLINVNELVQPFLSEEYSYRVFKKGFIPEFIPKSLMHPFQIFEKFSERIPLLNLFAAHNVIVAKKL